MKTPPIYDASRASKHAEPVDVTPFTDMLGLVLPDQQAAALEAALTALQPFLAQAGGDAETPGTAAFKEQQCRAVERFSEKLPGDVAHKVKTTFAAYQKKNPTASSKQITG